MKLFEWMPYINMVAAHEVTSSAVVLWTLHSWKVIHFHFIVSWFFYHLGGNFFLLSLSWLVRKRNYFYPLLRDLEKHVYSIFVWVCWIKTKGYKILMISYLASHFLGIYHLLLLITVCLRVKAIRIALYTKDKHWVLFLKCLWNMCLKIMCLCIWNTK